MARQATDLMAQYAAYHRDRRNIATHFVGIPLIVFAIGVLLARAQFHVGDWTVSAAWLVWGGATVWYLTRGNFVLGLSTALVNAVLMALAHPLADGSFGSWLAWGLGSFIVGWIIQFVGHYYEGRKPAFVDDITGLVIGPLFVAAEAAFLLGLRKEVERAVVDIAGPTCIREKKSLA